ncbi:hypothetical protein J4E80_003881 [Alternaria sp. BMP 0032]|nr:hypothetical protein J4E80_003881 [Alternaria sp. BMP 0032]
MVHVQLDAVASLDRVALVQITTEQFCGDKKVKHKTCSKNNGNARVVGYYEGWATTRSCNVFLPEQIPIGVYTHINFAFAVIDPKTFKIAPSSPEDVNLYKRLTLLKKRDPNLKVYIAIGGWAFNDPGPTATTFSDLAASVPRQKAFMESVLSFMSTYGFDGLDLDWEYPVSEERAGRKADFDNFPKFMARLKKTLSASSKGLTITLPASYWYLQHFDLVNLADSVNWFNIMSYDLHGTWDQGNKFTGAFLNSHTNLTEIDMALDLLWRNDIDPSQVVLGLAFYGRTFTMTTATCNKPGCTYQSGGRKGDCSKEVGILLNSEIDDIIEARGISPVLYKKEATKVVTWGNQWVSYDDEETLIMKSEYAQTLCLGGLMVWAISHDTKDAKYHKALAKAANRKISAQPVTDGSDDAYEDLEVPRDQCKWSNCGESCPSGWVHVKRSDPGARDDEYMIDETGCGGRGLHSCGSVEVGGNNEYCKKVLTYQAACCTTDTRSMKLYTKGEWGEAPNCDKTSGCPVSDPKKTDMIGGASRGSGGAVCNAYYKFQLEAVDPPEERKYCYDSSDKKERFSDCEFYTNHGFIPSGAPDGWCLSGCPNNRVRVGLSYGGDCAEWSYKALCCVPNISETIQIENPKLEEYRDALEEYIKDPRCSVPQTFGKRDSLSLIKRDLDSPYDVTHQLLLGLIAKTASSSMYDLMSEAWNKAMGTTYSSLKFPKLREFVTELDIYKSRGPIEVAYEIMCSLNYWNSRAAGGSKTLVCYDPSYDKDAASPARLARSIPSRHHHHHYVHRHALSHSSDHTLAKRVGRARDYRVEINGGVNPNHRITITMPEYLQINDLPPTEPIMDEVIEFEDVDDCGNPRIHRISLPTQSRRVEMEHPFDGQLIARFMRDASNGVLRSGATAVTGRVAVSYFVQAETAPVLLGAPPLPGDAGSSTDPYFQHTYARVMECIGSKENRAYFVLLSEEIHDVKTNLMQLHDAMSDTNVKTELDNGVVGAQKILRRIKAAIATIRYLNYEGDPNVNYRLTQIVNNAGAQWRHSQQIHNANNPNDLTTIGDYWSEWIIDFFEKLVSHTKNWCMDTITKLRKHWGVRTGAEAQQILDALSSLQAALPTLYIKTDHMF